MPDARVVGDGENRGPHQHQRQVAPQGARVALEVGEQLLAALVFVDAADVDDKGRRDAVLLAEPFRVRAGRHLGADAHDDVGHGVVAGDGLDHRALLEGVVHEAAHAAEDRAEDRQAHRPVALGGRHEERPGRGGADAVVGVVVTEAEEEEEVVARLVPADAVDERRRRRPLARQPRELVGDGMGRPEHVVRPPAEALRVARSAHGEAPHAHAVHVGLAGRELVPPRDVVAGARGQHVHVGAPRQLLGHVTGVELGPAVDVEAVPLDNDREFHWSVGSPAPREGASAGPGSRPSNGRPFPPSRPPAFGVSAPSPASPGSPAAAPPATGCPAPALRPRRLRRRRARCASPLTGAATPAASTSRRAVWAVPGAGAGDGRRRRLGCGPGARPVLHHALERPRAPIAEVEPARHGLDAHLQVLDLDREARQLQHEVVHHLVVQRRGAFELLPGVLVDRALAVEHLDDRVRVDEQLEHRVQQPPDARDQPAAEPPRRAVDQVVVERVVLGRRDSSRRRAAGLPQACR